jgi:teichuronic acid biosynthesis glycosyltransferase TuaC
LPLRQLGKLVRSEKIDFVHVHGGDMAEYGHALAKLTDRPFAITLHGSDVHTRPHAEPRYRRVLLLALREADLAIFVSHYLLEEARKLGHLGPNCLVVPNGIDTSLFHREGRMAGNSIGFVGSLSELKRAEILPEVFARLAASDPSLDFIVVGDGPLRARLEHDFRSKGLSGRLRMTGEVSQEDVARLMRGMKVLILPSRKESWGCVAKEAQASGAMVVGSANGGIPESVGSGGVCVPDGEDLAGRYHRAISALLAKPLSAGELAEACNGYDWHEMVAREEAEIQRIVLARGTRMKGEK